DELYVDYVIFEPVTAKVKQLGRAHQRIYQTGRGGISLPNKNSPIYSEYALRQAALEAADRILSAFDIKVDDKTPFLKVGLATNITQTRTRSFFVEAVD